MGPKSDTSSIPENRPATSSDDKSKRSRSPRPPNPMPRPIKKKKKKKEGRKKGERGPLPSNHHPDVEAPSMAIIEKALKPFKGVTKRWSVKFLQPPPSAYHDEQGRMLLGGCSGGRYMGDVFGGLPHGVGQHWVPVGPKGKEHLLYEGEWEFGGKTGNGIFFYLNGQVSITKFQQAPTDIVVLFAVGRSSATDPLFRD